MDVKCTNEDYVVYNTILHLVVHELVNDGFVIKQQKEATPDDPEDRYEATQNLDKICKEFRDSGLLDYWISNTSIKPTVSLAIGT